MCKCMCSQQAHTSVPLFTSVTTLLSCPSLSLSPLQEAECETEDRLACWAPDSGGDRPPARVRNGGGAVDTMPHPRVKGEAALGIFFHTSK